MEIDKLTELRERAKHVGEQVKVLKDAEELVEFFMQTLTRAEVNELEVSFGDTRVSLSQRSPGGSVSSTSPSYIKDNTHLWDKITKELHTQLRTVLINLLTDAWDEATRLRDEALCEVSGEEFVEDTAGRQPRNIRIQEACK